MSEVILNSSLDFDSTFSCARALKNQVDELINIIDIIENCDANEKLSMAIIDKDDKIIASFEAMGFEETASLVLKKLAQRYSELSRIIADLACHMHYLGVKDQVENVSS